MANGKFITWGEGGFSPDSWSVVYDLIKKYHIKTVLEYGCGVSTELLMAVGMNVISLETQEEYANIPNANIILYKYPNFPLVAMHDMAFIDGPGAREFEIRGAIPEREHSAFHALLHARKVIYLHDGGLGQEKALDSSKDWVKVRGGDSNIAYVNRNFL